MKHIPSAVMIGALVLAASATELRAAPATELEAADEAEVFYSVGGIDLLGRSPHYLDVGVGVWDFREGGERSNRSAAGRIELRIGQKLYFVGPALGVEANTDGGVYAYGGLYGDAAFGDFVLTILGGAGGYRQGDSSDLGSTLLFRAKIGLAYQFEDRSRLGLSFAHISNAGTGGRNSGAEQIYLGYAFAF